MFIFSHPDFNSRFWNFAKSAHIARGLLPPVRNFTDPRRKILNCKYVYSVIVGAVEPVDAEPGDEELAAGAVGADGADELLLEELAAELPVSEADESDDEELPVVLPEEAEEFASELLVVDGVSVDVSEAEEDVLPLVVGASG